MLMLPTHARTNSVQDFITVGVLSVLQCSGYPKFVSLISLKGRGKARKNGFLSTLP